VTHSVAGLYRPQLEKSLGKVVDAESHVSDHDSHDVESLLSDHDYYSLVRAEVQAVAYLFVSIEMC
jgi:hypothetical protein